MAHGIRRVAVLGAGTMGAAIAAHCANAGLEVDLLDIAPKEGDDKNAIVKGGFDRMQKAKPANLMSKTVAKRIRLGNFDDDFDRVAEANWILEAIIEKLEPKQGLMERVEEIAKDTAIVSSNTSGIPPAAQRRPRGPGRREYHRVGHQQPQLVRRPRRIQSQLRSQVHEPPALHRRHDPQSVVLAAGLPKQPPEHLVDAYRRHHERGGVLDDRLEEVRVGPVGEVLESPRRIDNVLARGFAHSSRSASRPTDVSTTRRKPRISLMGSMGTSSILPP